MHLEIRYLTTFTYDTAVSESQNALRARPVSDGRQRLIKYSVTVDPPAQIVSYTDYWGTQVDCFGVVGRHTRLTVSADSVVETSAQPLPADSPAWPHKQDDARLIEFLTPSPHVRWGADVSAFARDAVAGADSLVGAIEAIHHATGDRLKYETGATEVGVSVDEVFAQGAGVCQDYAHLALAGYRTVGIPARYVSGYLYAADASSGDRPEDAEVLVSTHAWVEVHVPGHGWWGLDPTNQQPVGEQHVKIGHGRDYDDVMPLRGVYHGEGESKGLEATVRMSSGGLQPFALQPQPAPIPRQDQAQQ